MQRFSISRIYYCNLSERVDPDEYAYILFFQEKAEIQEVEQLLAFFKIAFSHIRRLSVIVENSQAGHYTLSQIVEKCSKYGREVVGQHMITGEITEETLLALNLHTSNVVFADVNQGPFEMLLKLAKETGLISFSENLRMFLTKRSIAGIHGICNKPSYHYYFSDYQQSSSNATYIAKKINECRRMGSNVDEVTCSTRYVMSSCLLL